MIIWLASYPKSGNTWVRTIIGQLINNNYDSSKVFEKSKDIRLYPSKIDFIDLDDDFKVKFYSSELKKKIFDKTVVNWHTSQLKINLKKQIQIFKTHNMLCRLKVDNKYYSFTNLENSGGSIYIVRDPRNILTSLINHFSFTDEDEAFEFITNEDQTIGLEENTIPQLLSSWKNHYNSWKRFPKNNLLIKYEDLVCDPKKQIQRLVAYLSKLFKLSVTESQINKVILNSSFNNLQNLEKEGMFNENAFNTKIGMEKKFFHLGIKNDWKKMLNKKLLLKIENIFNKEMLELGYL